MMQPMLKLANFISGLGDFVSEILTHVHVDFDQIRISVVPIFDIYCIFDILFGAPN